MTLTQQKTQAYTPGLRSSEELNYFPNNNMQTSQQANSLAQVSEAPKPVVTISLGQVTSTNGSVRKKFDLVDGKAVKDENHDLWVSDGDFEDLAVQGLEGLAELFDSTKSNVAYTLGVCGLKGRQKLTTGKKLKANQGWDAIARCKDSIGWPEGPKLLMLDVDPEPGTKARTAQELWELMTRVIPELKDVGYVVTESTSSQIFNKETGERLRGPGGFHMFLVVTGDVETFSETLKALFWAEGRGFFKLGNPNKKTKVSSLLERFPVDMAVFSPERLVYEAGALLGPGLVQRRSKAQVFPGGTFDLDLIVASPEQTELAKVNRDKARKVKKAEQLEFTTAAVQEETGFSNKAKAKKEAQKRIAMNDAGKLYHDHPIYLMDGTMVLAGDMAEEHDQMTCKDPEDPDYHGGAQKGKIYWNDGEPTIHSQAHGGKTYTVTDMKLGEWLAKAQKAKGAKKSDKPVDLEKASVAAKLIHLGQQGVEYFKTPDGVVYADITKEGRRETVAVRSTEFSKHLRAELYKGFQTSTNSDAMSQAVATLEAIATQQEVERAVCNRVAKDGGDIYIDLAANDWKAVKVTPEGWDVVSDYPVRFRRGGAAKMPEPIKGGDLEDFRALCQLDQDTWVKVLCWMVQAMMPSKEYPVLIVGGVRGSGKSTITAAIKQLIDPTFPLTRGNVGDIRAFAIHASKRHTIAIDNLSGLTAEQSDILCRASTGSGHAERTLHTDDDERVFEFTNPLILNGIGSIASRDDLLNRAIGVSLQQPATKVSQQEFTDRLTTILPGVLGSMFDLISEVLAYWPSVKGTYKGKERFSGFMEVSLAVEKAMGWESGTVLGVFNLARAEAHRTAVESSPVGLAILQFMEEREYWNGSAQELLDGLNNIVSAKISHDKNWPGNGLWLSKRIFDRLAPDLLAMGIEVVRGERGSKARSICIRKVEPKLDE
jgi:hypothetical protein